jgi:hypothetical protein
MPVAQKPQSSWVTSFVVFSLLACIVIAGLVIAVSFVARRVAARFGGSSAQESSLDIRSDVRLPSATTGWDGVVTNLLSAFDQVDVLALEERRGNKGDAELRLRLVRDPDFPFRVNSIIVEFGSSLHQAILDRYIDAQDVSKAEIEQVWRDTTQVAAWDAPVYAEFLAAVREVNRKLPPLRRVHVIADDPPIDWDRVEKKQDVQSFLAPFMARRRFPVSINHVAVQTGQRALVIYADGRLRRPRFPQWASAREARLEEQPGLLLPAMTPPIFKALQVSKPGRIFVVRTITGLNPFQGVLQSTKLPLLVPLSGMYSANDARLTDDADACIYFGDSPDVTAVPTPDPAIYRNTPYGEEVARRKMLIVEQ